MPESEFQELKKEAEQHTNQSTQEKQKIKEAALTRSKASTTLSIADAVVIKDENLFFLTNSSGQVPLNDKHGFGLYFQDCRYLNGYEMKIEGKQPEVLMGSAEQGFQAIFELTIPELPRNDGDCIPATDVGIRWERIVSGIHRTLQDTITFTNFTESELSFTVSFAFQALFEDVYIVRGLLSTPLGQWVRPPVWNNNKIRFLYKGIDQVYRSLLVQISAVPLQCTQDTTADVLIKIKPHQKIPVLITLSVQASEEEDDRVHSQPVVPSFQKAKKETQDNYSDWFRSHTQIHTDNILLNDVINRSLHDLNSLRSHIGSNHFFSAGIPWFGTLFGRDSVIAALQTLAFNPKIAEETLNVLSNFQGTKIDEWKNEEPGKILHEVRVGELARAGKIPYTPFYGTVDATLLFLILVGRSFSWTGKLDLFHRLRSHIDAAVSWMDRYGDSDGDGYIDYQSHTQGNLINQGWKDSGNAIVNSDASLAVPPIALVEVQGYAYRAKREIAGLYERAGDLDIAKRLENEAEQLRERFNRDFWLSDRGHYAMALQKDRRPAAVMSSNAGQVLWTGIADTDKANQTAVRIMEEDMFSGWGVRTLSNREKSYNPISYHLGSVWPHDNSLIAAGLRQHGRNEDSRKIISALLDATQHFTNNRLPELFCGFSRKEIGIPVKYPVACNPQAWGAGTIPYLLEQMLGLHPEAPKRSLRIVEPMLPPYTERVSVQNLRIGSARVHLLFEKKKKDVEVHVVDVEGDLEVVMETEKIWRADHDRP